MIIVKSRKEKYFIAQKQYIIQKILQKILHLCVSLKKILIKQDISNIMTAHKMMIDCFST